MLRKHGHDVRHALDGEAALAQVDEWRPDVVLSDLSLGSGINGWELAQQLR
jgi:CheY-like chemotaxis protein